MGWDMQRNHTNRLTLALLTALGLTASAADALANTITVDRCNDESGIQYFGKDLREAVAAAISGDTVDLSGLACSAITLAHGEVPIYVDDLTIKGPTDHALTIDAQNASRIFSAESASVELYSLRLYRGTTSLLGGCIYDHGGDLTLKASQLSGCHAQDGGGAYANRISLFGSTVIYSAASRDGGGIKANWAYAFSSEIRGNFAGRDGGGISAYLYASIGLASIIASNNASRNGGGVYSTASLKVHNSSFVDNHSVGYGGALFDAGLYGSSTDIQDSILQGNTSGAAGGAIATRLLTLGSSTVSGNESGSGGGGGIYVKGFAYVLKSTIDNNVANGAGEAGGGLKIRYGADILNSTISGNHAAVAGGVSASGPTGGVVILNSTIAFNSAEQAESAAAVLSACEIDIKSSIFAKNSGAPDLQLIPYCYNGSPLLEGDHNLVMSSNLFFAGDIKTDPQLAPLAFNGGTVRTHALGPGSPAIDAGSNSKPFTTDQRGGAFARVVGDGADIGAFERQTDEDQLFRNGFE